MGCRARGALTRARAIRRPLRPRTPQGRQAAESARTHVQQECSAAPSLRARRPRRPRDGHGTPPRHSRTAALRALRARRWCAVGLTELLSDPDGTAIPLPPARLPPGAVGAADLSAILAPAIKLDRAAAAMVPAFKEIHRRQTFAGNGAAEGNNPLRLTSAGYSSPG